MPQASAKVADLTDRPRGIDLEHRVITVNNAGNSVPSNTVAAVL